MDYTLIVLLTYVAVMLGVTVLMTKKENNIERFCVGNRNTGWMVSALSIAATWIWAPALFNRECLYKRLCRALLVSGSERAVSDTVHSLCKED